MPGTVLEEGNRIHSESTRNGHSAFKQSGTISFSNYKQLSSFIKWVFGRDGGKESLDISLGIHKFLF